MSWAIRNRKTRKFVYGTDYRFFPPHQRTDYNKAILYGTQEEAESDLRWRRCGKFYEVVPVRIEVLED